MDNLLSKINHPKQLRAFETSQLDALAHEMREFILETLSVKPGHLGASLGVIELTIALHYHYNTPKDLLIWDVGHQCYPHKILTGRKEIFDSLRQKNGISGFPTRIESEFDTFGTGHSSTSISAIVGMATADKINNIHRKHIAIIGDASITSGMSLEALNHLGSTDLDVLVILNDNDIGIDPSVGGLKKHFKSLDNQSENIFTNFGLNFIGTIDGHNFEELFNAFDKADAIKGPKVLHIKTTKGKGYEKAEIDQVKWHAPGLFDKDTGELKSSKKEKSYQDVFGETMHQLLENNPKIVAITPAMLTGSNLVKCYHDFPNRVVDVGIAEQHAVTFAAGLATQDTLPYCVIYSTFLQRAYDQVIHDVALQNLPVVFCIDRAGFVGTDGATHHGYFDIAYLRKIPNMIVSSPRNEKDFKNLLYTAQFTEQPFAIRYPKNSIKTNDSEPEKITIGQSEIIFEGNKLAILSTGLISSRIEDIILQNNIEDKIALIDFPFIKPLDESRLKAISLKYTTILTFEDGIKKGGFGSGVLEFLNSIHYKGNITINGYPDEFIEHASISELNKMVGLDDFSILDMISSYL
jgi:1-deoxy-D-xylulose-5-phosphate synthase